MIETPTTAQDDLRSDVEALRRDLHDIRKDLAELTSGLVHAGQHGVRDLNDRVQSAVRHRAEQVKEVADSARHKIEERPLVSVAGAFASGLVVGMIVHRCRRGDD